MKKIKMKEVENYFKKTRSINALLLMSIGLTFLSCAKNKEYETVYKAAEIVAKSNLVSTDDTYIYVPSTLQVPRTQSEARAYFQGDEKIVKFRYTEKNLEIIQLDSDSRFSANEQNAAPVISIPVAYKDYNCIENAQKECSQKEEENTKTDWTNKKFVLPDYSGLKINEVNTLDLISIDSSCAKLTDTKLIDYEINPTTLNIELERSYQTSTDWRCIAPLYFNDELSKASFKVRYFYSFVKLNSVTTPDFKPFVYEKEDQRTFGFFKTEINKLNKYFDFARIEKQHLANHWSPNRKSIDFYLDPKFYTEENKNLLNATEESFQKINDGLKEAGATIRINIAGKATKPSGDIRFNRINLLDEPQDTGLLGYGPSIANPLTGEIVQAHINMYSGVLTQTIRNTYNSMVDLKVNDSKSVGNETESPVVNSVTTKSLDKRIENYNSSLKLNLTAQTKSRSSTKKLSLSETGKINLLLDKESQKIANNTLDLLKSNTDANSIMAEEDKNNLIRANSKICDAELINFAKIAKKELPNIRLIPGVVSEVGNLIPWDQLTDEARQGVLDLILPKVYIQTLVHEIGHTLGLRHNFMGSFDKNNFYSEEESKRLGLHTAPVYSSIMDYANSELNSLGTLGKYDIAALRYMYARKVKNRKGNLLDIKTSIKDLNAYDKVTMHKYLYCTDENAGLSPTCNRFDEGSTLTEIALSKSEAYENNYKIQYFRNGRTKFDIYGINSLTMRRYSDFRRARQIYETYEFYNEIFGSELMEIGCTKEEVDKYPVCKEINDAREATSIIARMFLNIIKTPDLTCFVDNLSGENIHSKELVKLSSVVNQAEDGCFGLEAINYFNSKNQKVLAQGGKFLNSIQETNPKYAVYSSDIAVRGHFQDKLLALQFLVTRYLGINGKEDVQGSMMDISSVSDEVNNYFAHILTGEKLINPIKFTDIDGNEVDIEYSLSHDSIIPEPATSLITDYFGFPTNSNVEFNRLAIQTGKSFSSSNDVQYRSQTKAFSDSLSVAQVNKFNSNLTNLSSTDLSVTMIDKMYFLAASENFYAKQMINSINAEDTLMASDPSSIKKILDLKNAVINIPGAENEHNSAFKDLPEEMRKQLITLKKKEIKLTIQILVPQFGQDSAQKLMLAYALSVDEMNEIQSYIEEQRSLGKDATEEEKALYLINNDTLLDFIEGKLAKQNELFIKSLDIMSPL